MDDPLKPNKQQLWGGRFGQDLDDKVLRYTQSLHLDRRLAEFDLMGSRAHVRMLGEQRILDAAVVEKILKGLDRVEKEIRSGTFPFREELEDIHMNIEKRLIELVGEVGACLHSGRSRNDQVAVDLRLYCLHRSRTWCGLLLDLIDKFVAKAESLLTELFPGWTHMQSAQPISWAHYLLAFVEMFHRDYLRLVHFDRLHSVSPLGGGALSGSSLPLKPELTAKILDFDSSFGNSYDVAGDRDCVLDLLHIGSVIMIHLSRLAEDFVYMTSTPVSWVALPDAFCTGSSMMPQKKNPDVFELIRGKTASVIGHNNAVQVLLKGLPSSYQRDLQEDKTHLFPVVDIVESTLEIVAFMIGGFQVRTEKTSEALKEGFLLATDLAEYLVGFGVPFRTAHEKVGRLVRHCLESGLRFEDLSLEQIQAAIPEAGPEVLEVIDLRNYLSRRKFAGSCGEDPIRRRIDYWKEWIRGNGAG